MDAAAARDTIEIVDETDISPALSRAIVLLYELSFPRWREMNGSTRYLNGVAPAWVAVLRERGDLIAHAAVVDREIHIGKTPVRVAGVQGICVHPAHRRRGLCRVALERAMDEALARRFDLAILFTGKPHIFRSSGFECVDGSLWRFFPDLLIPRLPPWLDGSRAIGFSRNGKTRFRRAMRPTMWRALNRTTLPAGPIYVGSESW